jgi:polyisoprenoid-binding protein YceI
METTKTKWSIDQSHSDITFKVRHIMIAYVKGSFKIFDANVHTTNNDFTTAEIDLWIDASSISTGDVKRDEHLKGADFLDTKKHKQITFMANTMSQPDAEGNCDLWGDLTIKSTTRRIKLNVQMGGIINDPWGQQKAGFTITGTINRQDWNLAWNTALETGGVVVGNDIFVSCEIELSKESQKELTMEVEAPIHKKSIL